MAMPTGTSCARASFPSDIANVEYGWHSVSATRRVGFRKSVIFVAVLLALAVTGYVSMHNHFDSPLPQVRPIDPHKALFDLTPLTVTVTVGDQQVE